MIKLIGQTGCSRCDIVKNILTQKNVDFEYVLLDDLDKEVKKQYISIARESGKIQMPLIFKDNKIVDVKEVM